MVRLGVDTNEINAAGAARRGTNMREFLLQQGIDEAGFANIRTSEKSEFRWTFRREVGRIGSSEQKFGYGFYH